MKIKTALIILTFIVTVPLVHIYGEEKSGWANTSYLHFYLSSAWGQGQEMVYYPADHPYPWAGEPLSELLWDIPGVLFLGVEASWAATDLLSFSLNLQTRIHSGWGNMTDTDWIDSSDGTFFGNNEYDWTHHSRSDTTVDKAWKADGRLSYIARRSRQGAISFHAGLKRDTWSWTDKAYEFIYSHAPKDFDYEEEEEIEGQDFRKYKGTFGGVDAIDYEQNFLIPYGGFSIIAFINRFQWEAGFSFSPLVFSSAIDHHILTGTYYYDYATLGIYVRLKTALAYTLNDSVSLVLTMIGTMVPISTGHTLIRDTNADNLYKTTYPPGIGRYNFNAGFGIKYTF